MRVKYLSGNFAGYEEDVGEAHGEQMVQFGYAEKVLATPPTPPEPVSPALVQEPPAYYVYDRDQVIAFNRERADAGLALYRVPEEGHTVRSDELVEEPAASQATAGAGLTDAAV